MVCVREIHLLSAGSVERWIQVPPTQHKTKD